jgi:hypothetical protein
MSAAFPVLVVVPAEGAGRGPIGLGQLAGQPYCKPMIWDEMMKLLLYVPEGSAVGGRLKSRLAGVEMLSSVKECWNYGQLLAMCSTPDPLPETVVLMAESSADLESFAAIRGRLEQVYFILVLPDASEDTIACGHRLRPRFVTYRDSDFHEIEAVLNRLGRGMGKYTSVSVARQPASCVSGGVRL